MQASARESKEHPPPIQCKKALRPWGVAPYLRPLMIIANPLIPRGEAPRCKTACKFEGSFYFTFWGLTLWNHSLGGHSCICLSNPTESGTKEGALYAVFGLMQHQQEDA